MELKRILKQYALALVVIMCIGVFLSGIVSVREKTQYNMDMTPYDRVKIEKTGEGVLVRYGENEHFIRTDYTKKLINNLDEELLFDFRQIFN